MSNKKRNHFIPKVLLNRFASRKVREKSWIWQVGNTDSREISTKDAAVSSYFYGKPETGIEDLLGTVDGAIGSTLVFIDKGNDPNNVSEELRQICWNLAVRTRAIREQLSSMGNKTFDSFTKTVDSKEATSSITHYFDENLNEIIQKQAETLSRNERRSFLSKMKKKENRQQFLSMMNSRVNDTDILKNMSNHVAEKIKSGCIFSEGAKDGQLRTLLEALKYGSSPDWFQPLWWHIIELKNEYFILGDSCLFTQEKDGTVGSLFKFPNEWVKLYFPISPFKVLVGERTADFSDLSELRINQAQAEISQSYIYSAYFDKGVVQLSNKICEGEPIISNEKFEQFLLNPWS